MKIFAAAVGTETNSFSPIPTGLEAFRETLFVRRDGSLSSGDYFTLPLKAWRRLAAAGGHGYTESLSAFAQPGGPTAQSAWETLREMVLDDLRAAGPQDIVLLHLHGAMISTGCDDCEADLTARVREICGPDTVIGVELDLHCHIDARLLSAADAVVLYKEYPHTDLTPRAEELFEICRRTRAGEIAPVMVLEDLRMLGVWRTSEGPVRAFVDAMQAAETGAVLSLSLCHGFPWADQPEVGAKMLVITDGDAALARRVTAEFSARFRALALAHPPHLDTPAEIAGILGTATGVTVVADVSDNAGGGSASDSTFLLRDLIGLGCRDLLAGLYWDPVAVRLCREAGEGETLALRIGGKCSPMSGDPLDLTVTVMKIIEEATEAFGEGRQEMGPSVWLRCAEHGVDLVLISIRTQTFNPDAYTQFGIALEDYRAVLVKSAQHFYAGFGPVADRVLYARVPGTNALRFEEMALPKLARSVWPQDPAAAAEGQISVHGRGVAADA